MMLVLEGVTLQVLGVRHDDAGPVGSDLCPRALEKLLNMVQFSKSKSEIYRDILLRTYPRLTCNRRVSPIVCNLNMIE